MDTKLIINFVERNTGAVTYVYPLKGEACYVYGSIYKSDGEWQFRSSNRGIQFKLGNLDWSSAKGVLRMKLDELFKINVEPMNMNAECTNMCDCHISGKPCIMKQTPRRPLPTTEPLDPNDFMGVPKVEETPRERMEALKNTIKVHFPDETIEACKDKTADEIYKHLSQDEVRDAVVAILRRPHLWDEATVQDAQRKAADIIEGMK